MDEAASHRDALYRCLYLRREYAALQARAAVQAEEQERERLGLATTAATSSSSPAPPSHVVSPPTLPYQDDSTSTAPTTSAIPLDDLRDVILMPPHNAAMGIGSCGEAGVRLDGLSPLLTPAPASNSGIGGAAGTRAIGTDPMLREAFGWPGLVFIRNLPSPWYNGCFPFTVYFPSRYPFEAPIIELAGPLRSHPHVYESRVRDLEELGIGALGASMHTTVDALDTPLASSMTKTSASSLFSANKRYFIPFEDVYCGLDPMRVSVLSRLLQHVKRFFYPTEWPAAWQQQAQQQRPSSQLSTTPPAGTASEPYVNRVLARRDVDRRSATQEVVLGKPYVDYLGSDVLQHFLTAWEERTGKSLAVVCPSLGAASQASVDEAQGKEEDEDEKAGEIVFASWYNRSVLPHVLALP